jgi:hypothetical protein
MELLGIVALLVALAVAALYCGHDSRETFASDRSYLAPDHVRST